jgi:hypothetical protein
MTNDWSPTSVAWRTLSQIIGILRWRRKDITSSEEADETA